MTIPPEIWLRGWGVACGLGCSFRHGIWDREPAIGNDCPECGAKPVRYVLAGASPWRPIDDKAMNGQHRALITRRGSLVQASWVLHACEGEGGAADAWVALLEGESPVSWTDGICWAVNEDGEPSDPPVLWCPMPETE